MKTGSWFIASSLVLLHFTSCKNTASPGTTGVVRDSAGVRLIELPASEDHQPLVHLTIDTAWSADPGSEIGRLTDVAPTPDGRTLLLDGMAAEVFVLTETGDLVARFGRTGEGPGEFSSGAPLGGFVATDSSLFVPDLNLQRITEFSFSGEVLGITRYPLAPVYAVDWRRVPGGGLAFRALDPTGDRIIEVVGDKVDTLYSFPIRMKNPNMLLPPSALWDLTPSGGLVSARTDEATVELRAAETGELIWQTRWSGEGGELEESDRLHLESLVVESVERSSPGVSAEVIVQSIATVDYPDRSPVLAGLFSGPDGGVWVRSAKPVSSMGLDALRIGSTEGFGGSDWDVLGSDGLFRARVRLPDGFTPFRFREDWIYGAYADDLGVERAARVRAVF